MIYKNAVGISSLQHLIYNETQSGIENVSISATLPTSTISSQPALVEKTVYNKEVIPFPKDPMTHVNSNFDRRFRGKMTYLSTHRENYINTDRYHLKKTT